MRRKRGKRLRLLRWVGWTVLKDPLSEGGEVIVPLDEVLKVDGIAFLVRPFNIMVKQCPWCWKLTGFKKGGKGCTSGMCKSCYTREYAKIDQSLKREQ